MESLSGNKYGFAAVIRKSRYGFAVHIPNKESLSLREAMVTRKLNQRQLWIFLTDLGRVSKESAKIGCVT